MIDTMDLLAGIGIGLIIGMLLVVFIAEGFGDIINSKTLDNVCKKLMNSSNAYYVEEGAGESYNFICEIPHCCSNPCEPINMGNTRRIDFGGRYNE